MGGDVDVVWFIEHTAREMHVGCAVRHLLQSRFGRSVKILPYYRGGAETAAGTEAPAVAVIPYCYSVEDTGLRDHLPRWPGTTWFNLAWEELNYTAKLRTKAPRDTFARKHVIHHSWMEDFSDYLRRHGVPEEHIFLNGQPAYKLYDEPYRNVFTGREEMAERFGLDPSLKWIVFPENYGWGFMLNHALDSKVREGFSREDVTLMRDYCRSSFAAVLTWLRDLADEGSVEVILRPRPATTVADFRVTAVKTAGRIPPRLHIIKDGSVREWIMAGDIVVSSFSTSLIEAAFAGRPAYMAEPEPIPEPLTAPWYSHFPSLSTREEFLRVCLAGPDSDSAAAAEAWARRDLMGRGDAIANLAGFVDSLCGDGGLRPPVPTGEILTPPAPPPPTLAERLRYRLELPAIWMQRLRAYRTREDREQDRFTDDDVDELTRLFARALAADGEGTP